MFFLPNYSELLQKLEDPLIDYSKVYLNVHSFSYTRHSERSVEKTESSQKKNLAYKEFSPFYTQSITASFAYNVMYLFQIRVEIY